MMEPKISEQNFTQLAMRYYDNPQCTSVAEFEEDLKRFAYLKKLFGRYVEKSELKERLILNHLIILFNVFGVANLEFLFFKIDQEYWPILVTFLVYLGRMAEEIPEFGISATDFSLDTRILTVLENI